MVISQLGVVATSQTLASQAGAQVLARGGSAIDAAIAANAVLGVVEPMSCGMGGDLFVIYYDAKTGKLTGLNSSGWAPKKLTIDYLRDKGIRSMPQEDINSVTVPGAVAGWQALHQKFGRMPWREVFAPAIHYARQGFPVTEIIQDSWRASISKLSRDDDGRRVFLPKGRPPEAGELFRNPDLAKAMEMVAAKGADAFYRGPIRDAILKTSDRLGGVMQAADFAEFQPEWVEPISTTYRGWTVYELPPNGQGIAALEMLNIMERFDLSRMNYTDPDALHLKIEAQKLAYQDLIRYIADPRQAKVPIPQLLSKEYAAERASLVDKQRAQAALTHGDPWKHAGDTIYLSVIDRDGNIVSLIQSIYLGFGSGIVAEGMGFHLHNRGGLFELDPDHPNALAPHKRPLHTIIPAYMQKGPLHIGFGIMGGFNQAQAHAQFVSNIVDHDMNIQMALEAPRFTKLTFGGSDLYIEGRFPERTYEDLRSRGHLISVHEAYSGQMCGGQAVLFNAETGIHFGASSPRKDGAAVPEPVPFWQNGAKAR